MVREALIFRRDSLIGKWQVRSFCLCLAGLAGLIELAAGAFVFESASGRSGECAAVVVGHRQRLDQMTHLQN